jgi:dCTP deaminase
MILPDSQIKSLLPTLFPEHWESLGADGRIQPASVDLTIMGPLCRVAPPVGGGGLRPGKADLTEVAGPSWILRPGLFYLISTRERIVMPPDLVGCVNGRSSWGRVGLRIHATAGFIDPGFAGNITLELDIAGGPVEIREGDSICQVVFQKLSGPVERPYGSASKYQNQSGVTAARPLEKGISR